MRVPVTDLVLAGSSSRLVVHLQQRGRGRGEGELGKREREGRGKGG